MEPREATVKRLNEELNRQLPDPLQLAAARMASAIRAWERDEGEFQAVRESREAYDQALKAALVQATGRNPVPEPVEPRPVEGRRILAADLDRWFTYHAPTEAQKVAYANLRIAARALAQEIVNACPPGPDTTAAVRKVREAVMTANAAIACAE